MAQKKKKEPQKKEEEAFEWTPPDFDEREFLEKDINGTKTLFVTALVSFVCGVLAFLTTGVSWVLGFVVMIAGIVSLKYIYPLLKLPLKDIDKKTWAGNIAMFFLLSLGLWILFLNPPFSDHTEPQVNNVELWVQDGGQWTKMTTSNAGILIHSGAMVNISAYVVDNGKLGNVEISIYNGGQIGEYSAMTDAGNGIYKSEAAYNTTGGALTYNYSIRATDTSGNSFTLPSRQFLVNP
jgi:hypothetical protein